MPFCVSVTRVGCPSVCDQAATLVTSLSHPSVSLCQAGTSVTRVACLSPIWYIPLCVFVQAGTSVHGWCIPPHSAPCPMSPPLSTPVSPHVPAAPACTVTPRITCCHPGDWNILLQWPCSYLGGGGSSLPTELWSGRALAVPQGDNGDEVTGGSLSLLQVL